MMDIEKARIVSLSSQAAIEQLVLDPCGPFHEMYSKLHDSLDHDTRLQIMLAYFLEQEIQHEIMKQEIMQRFAQAQSNYREETVH